MLLCLPSTYIALLPLVGVLQLSISIRTPLVQLSSFSVCNHYAILPCCLRALISDHRYGIIIAPEPEPLPEPALFYDTIESHNAYDVTLYQPHHTFDFFFGLSGYFGVLYL